MAILSLAYVGLSRPLSRRYTSKWIYYVGLILLWGYLIPFRPSILIRVPRDVIAAMPAAASGPIQEMQQVEASTLPITTAQGNPTAGVDLLQLLWLCGVLVVLAFQTYRHIRFHAGLRRWCSNADDQTMQVLDEAKATMGVKQPVSIMLCSCISSPMLVKLTKPTILLPDADVDEENITMVLCHELVHYKRKDLWIKLLLVAAVSLNWFNPSVYLLAKTVMLHCEISFDEAVVRNRG